MFRNARRIAELEKELDQLRNFVIKLQKDTNDLAMNVYARLQTANERLLKLEEK